MSSLDVFEGNDFLIHATKFRVGKKPNAKKINRFILLME